MGDVVDSKSEGNQSQPRENSSLVVFIRSGIFSMKIMLEIQLKLQIKLFLLPKLAVIRLKSDYVIDLRQSKC